MEGESIQQPDIMANPFIILHTAGSSGLAARVGKFVLPGRKAIQTPHFIAITSRGTVAHISPDLARKHTSISSLYLGLEDFLEKATREVPPIFNVPQSTPHESRLRKFIAAQDDDILILGARRAVPVVAPQANRPNALAILTVVGFHYLEEDAWVDAVRKIRPDVIIGLSDMAYGHTPGVKRREKMVDRTHAYTRNGISELTAKPNQPDADVDTLYFAPILPLENTQQRLYLQDLEDELRPRLSGLALYDVASLSIIPESLRDLPRMCFSEPRTPHEILRNIALGADMLTVPFIGDLSDAGIAIDFKFPVAKEDQIEETDTTPKPLGLDLWNERYATEIGPISEGCQCYACQRHHRAYIRHLLSAKEMLAWSLLQIHNHHMMYLFFDSVRQSIAEGTFEADVALFERRYESELPPQTGQGPRLRGYNSHVSGPGEPRRNPPAYGRLNDAIEKYAEAQSSIATPDTNAEGLEEQGFAQKSATLD